MRKLYNNKSQIIFCLVAFTALCSFGKQEKILQIFRGGEVIKEYAISEIDYIEINDLISAPTEVNASVVDNKITIKWSKVEGATYNVYRSPDNNSFIMIASEIEETTYTDISPLRGSNYYRVKAIVGNVESGYTQSATATLTSSEMDNGIYLGIMGFNQSIFDYPVLRLTNNTVDGFRGFISNLTMQNGTLLYYSVDQALNSLQATELPSDLSTAAIVTFTDGLDQGSMMKDVPYESDMEYLDGLNNRIKHETISGQPITAFSIGIRGKDVGDIDMFRTNLEKLSSSSENATEVTSMTEVNAKFQEIARTLTQNNYVQTINLKIPGVSNGTLVRFTFDNVNSAMNSEVYIEGRFNLKEKSLEDVTYVGLSSVSGSTIKGVVDGIFVSFKFEGVRTEGNFLIKSEFTDEWTYVVSSSLWQINSEFDKTENSDIETERNSAVIMLVLDCSKSLAEEFETVKNNAIEFVNSLYDAVTSENEADDISIFSTEPIHLSLAVEINGTRYYLKKSEFDKTNLTGANILGVTVKTDEELFILRMNDAVDYPDANVGESVPTPSQGRTIGINWYYINKAIESYNGVPLNGFYGATATEGVLGLYYSNCFYNGNSLTNPTSVPKARYVIGI